MSLLYGIPPRTIPRIALGNLRVALRAAWRIPAWGGRGRIVPKATPQEDARGRRRPLPLVLYSQVAWDDVWQRPQEMAAGLARRGRPVLFLGPVQVHDRAGRYVRAWREIREEARFPGLCIAAPLIFSGEYRWPWARALNRLVLRAEARRIIALWLNKIGRADLSNLSDRSDRSSGSGALGSDFIFLTNSPFCDDLAESLGPRAVIYDVIDDFPAFGWAPRDGRRCEEHLLRLASRVWTGTGARERAMTPRHSDVRFIPCGVDFERFAAGAAAPEPPELSALPRPILGYMGTVSDRLDRDLIAALAQKFPDASLVFVGPVHGSFGPPLEAPNLHFMGLRPPEALAAWVARFDVALMPFAQTPAARAINPVKTLEYLAAGCPVVSTPIPDVERFFSDVVEIAPAIESFVGAVERLVHAPDDARRRAGIERARRRSWGAMIEEMEAEIDKL